MSFLFFLLQTLVSLIGKRKRSRGHPKRPVWNERKHLSFYMPSRWGQFEENPADWMAVAYGSKPPAHVWQPETASDGGKRSRNEELR